MVRRKTEKVVIESLTDEELLLMIVARNELALEEVVKRHGKKVRGILFSLLRCLVDVSEVENAVWFRLWQYAHMFDGRSEFSTWLYRVAWNEGAMQYRRRKRKKNLPWLFQVDMEIAANTVVASEPDNDNRERLLVLAKRIQSFEVEYREAIECQFFELTNKEAAKRCGVTLPSYKSRLCRGRRALRRCL